MKVGYFRCLFDGVIFNLYCLYKLYYKSTYVPLLLYERFKIILIHFSYILSYTYSRHFLFTLYLYLIGLEKDILIDVFVLDERYDREPMPCETRRDYCNDVVLPDITGIIIIKTDYCYPYIILHQY